MALFRRRSVPDTPDDATAAAEQAGDELAEAGAEDTPDSDAEAAAERVDVLDAGWDRSGGPFDETERDLADPEIPRLDLGSLLIPGLPGISVQVEADPNTQEVKAITGVAEDGAVQLQAFAAPRSEGIWAEIRAEMLAEIKGTPGARVREADGAFGPELQAVLPARTPEGKTAQQPLRFTGVDGPRWFLRAVFLGRAAVQPDPDDALHRLVRQTVVVRGAEAMAPRDPLPLRLPEQPPGQEAGDSDAELDDEIADELADELADDIDDDDEATPSRYADLNPFERGPEITEIR